MPTPIFGMNIENIISPTKQILRRMFRKVCSFRGILDSALSSLGPTLQVARVPVTPNIMSPSRQMRPLRFMNFVE